MEAELTGRPDDEGGIPFGRYRLIRVLGRGGMGEVFLAVAHGAAGFRKKLVIKRILPELARDEAFVRRFLAEGKLVVQLQHPHIVQVLDMGEEAGEIFIAMEYVDGWDLGRILDAVRADGAQMPLSLALLVLLGVAEALAYAHAAAGDDGRPLGLVHRDISPSNVMVGRQGLVKLLDFGIAAAGRDKGAEGAGGKYAWMAPEQARGEAATPRSDLFSLGIVAWEVLTGAHPFRGYSVAQTTERIQTMVPPSLDTVAPGLPAVLVELVAQLLAKDPLARPADGYEVVRRLREAAVAVGPLRGLDELGEWLAGLEARTASPWGDLGDFVSGAGLGVDELLGLGLGRAMAGGGRERTVTAIGGSGLQPVTALGVVSVAAPVVAPAPRGEAEPEAFIDGAPAARPWAWVLVAVAMLVVGVAFAWSAAGSAEGVASADGTSLVLMSGAVGGKGLPGTSGVSIATDVTGGELDVVLSDVVAAAPNTDIIDPVDVPPEDTDVVPMAPTDPPAPDVGPGETVDFEIIAEAEPVMHTVRVETDPPGARVSLGGIGSGRSPYAAEAAAGTRILVRASLDGFEGRSATVTVDGPETVRFKMTPTARGEVRFRVLPADAVVSLDGVKIDLGSGGVVVGLSVVVGQHRLTVKTPSGATEERVFEVAAGESKNLRTIVVRDE